MPVYYLFIALIFVYLLPSVCDAKAKYQKVVWVYDGDTLRLEDGRKIRLIGIDAPEVAHHKKKGQPYGREATEKLRELLKHSHYRVRLEIDRKKKDRYKRHLAHVFLPDGTNLSQWMLQNGWASLMVFPPNTRYIKNYQKAEQSAQQQKRFIWRQKNHQQKKPSQLKGNYRGYVRLKSTIKSIKITKNSIFLELDQKIFIKLRKSNLQYFSRYNPKKLLYHDIIVSGRLYKTKRKRIIHVRHSVQLTVID